MRRYRVGLPVSVGAVRGYQSVSIIPGVFGVGLAWPERCRQLGRLRGRSARHAHRHLLGGRLPAYRLLRREMGVLQPAARQLAAVAAAPRLEVGLPQHLGGPHNEPPVQQDLPQLETLRSLRESFTKSVVWKLDQRLRIACALRENLVGSTCSGWHWRRFLHL